MWANIHVKQKLEVCVVWECRHQAVCVGVLVQPPLHRGNAGAGAALPDTFVL